MKNTRLGLLGVPTDAGGAMKGSSLGPDALRIAGLQSELERLQYVVTDYGDVQIEKHRVDTMYNIKNYERVVAENSRVFEICNVIRRQGYMPIVLGGDHHIAYGSITSYLNHVPQEESAAVLWLDAHADINTDESSRSSNFHGMPVAALMGHMRNISDLPRSRVLQSHELIYIGTRSLDEYEARTLKERNIQYWTMADIDKFGIDYIMRDVFTRFHNRRLHVSFDVDFLDPSYAPGVSTDVMGGPTYREARQIFEILSSASIESVDIVEVNPATDDKNRTAEVVVDLVGSLFGKLAYSR